MSELINVQLKSLASDCSRYRSNPLTPITQHDAAGYRVAALQQEPRVDQRHGIQMPVQRDFPVSCECRWRSGLVVTTRCAGQDQKRDHCDGQQPLQGASAQAQGSTNDSEVNTAFRSKKTRPQWSQFRSLLRRSRPKHQNAR